MEVNFRISDYNVGALWPQMSQALEYKSILEKLDRNRNQPNYGRDISKMSPANAVEYNASKRRRTNLILGIVFLAFGLFMLTFAGNLPEYTTIMTAFGAVAAVFGVFGLWSSRKSKISRFDSVAKSFLTKLSKLNGIRVIFSDEGMKVANGKVVPYSKLGYVAECKDIFFITWQDQMIVLQKKDAVTGNYRKLMDLFKSQAQNPNSVVAFE